jgi:hypothetical protein
LSSKAFEKLILKRRMDDERENIVDLTGSEQHGLKSAKAQAPLVWSNNPLSQGHMMRITTISCQVWT